MGLVGEGETCALKPIGGGVSCDVFEVRVGGRVFCVKRALEKLRVKADWCAPAMRSISEARWMRLAAGIDAKLAPKILGEDPEHHLFAMSYFPPETYPVWKSLLAEGKADADFAAEAGRALARIHAFTAGREDISRDFDNGAQFHALRIEPYLLFTAGKHPDVADTIRALAKSVESARIALMHGDVSPKNILCGPNGPVFLDAETCCYGDPAFDLAFCLNHFLLKGVWHPEYGCTYAACFTAFMDAYFAGADWEARAGLDRRAAALLAAFLLARIDGKSPVEYITDDRKKNFVRTKAKAFLANAPDLKGLCARWTAALANF